MENNIMKQRVYRLSWTYVEVISPSK